MISSDNRLTVVGPSPSSVGSVGRTYLDTFIPYMKYS